MKNFYIYILTIFSLIFGCTPMNPFEKMGGPEYYPSEEGMWWKYKVNTDIPGYENFRTMIRWVGEGTIKLYSLGDELTAKTFYYSYLDSLNDTISKYVSYIYISNMLVLDLNNVTFPYQIPTPLDFPTPILYFPLYEGLKWEQVVDEGGFTFYYLKAECKGKENIIVPAGEFNAYKIVYIYHEWKSIEGIGKYLFTRIDWYAENIGRIKRHFENNSGDIFETELIEWGKGK